jgi:ABC-type multidrug transport system fused ATPase/permease subunit
MNDLRKLIRYFQPYRFSLAIAITCILGYVLFNLSIPLVVGRAIDAN